MYRYDTFDREFVRNRVAQFRQQVERRIDGSLTEEEFKPLRLMNGLYLQLHAYMLRVAIPYGTLDSRQMRQLAHITERWDKGYGHFTTRQNVQFNWPKLKDVPDILDALADVEMHAIQTSGNCVRNVTADHFAGAAADEISDPRPTAELLRQWSTDHPEFAFLPRKFKIAVSGSPVDRAVTRAHDIGIRMILNAAGEIGYEICVGGGLGRTPVIGSVIRDFLPEADLLPYVESILQVYNAIGRRDNKFKVRIKITVREHGNEAFRDRVEERFRIQRKAFGGADQELLKDIRAMFAESAYIQAPTGPFEAALARDPVFRAFVDTNVHPHRNPDYAIVTISLKAAAQRRAMPARTRCAPSPIWRSGTGMTRSGSATSKTAFCPTCTGAMCRRFMRRCGRRTSRPPMSVWHRTLSPAPGWITAIWRPPVPSRSPRVLPPG